MFQVTLHAPAISCEHCIATITRTTDALPGAHFLAGDIEGQRFAVEVAHGAILDALAEALAVEGYPLGDAALTASSRGPATDRPTVYRLKATDAGAEVNYDCPCGCVAGFALNRALVDQEPESCCCGRTLLVGRSAADRLQAYLDGGAFAYELQTLTMPWGQPLEAALAVPPDATHGRDAD